MDMITPDVAIKVVDRINSHFVYEGLPARLEHLVPLVQFHYCADEYGVEYCGFGIWNTACDDQYITEDAFERFLLARIAEIRKVIIHATIGIPNSVLDTMIDEAEEKL
jgi:hypothetical protein|uniref:Uncharacterized protein n=1 Tax=Myoviridae sp. ctshb19 TaxID=2825194 RepID=A0A8S5UGZ7_9CAUD|nr:MAG TPA: hypothetical protein [Myoviridae sp. ctshb19]